jgi:hypothetical protein
VFDLDETLIKASLDPSKLLNEYYDEKVNIVIGDDKVEKTVNELFK